MFNAKEISLKHEISRWLNLRRKHFQVVYPSKVEVRMSIIQDFPGFSRIFPDFIPAFLRKSELWGEIRLSLNTDILLF